MSSLVDQSKFPQKIKFINFDLSQDANKPELVERLLLINQQTKSTRWGRAEFEGLFNQDSLELNLVLSDQQVCGFAVFSLAKIEAYLVNLAISPDYQGLGLGSALMQFSFEEQARNNISECWLEVRQSNIAAQKFYKSLGFEFCAVRKNFYQQPDEDGQAWVKKIKNNF